MAFLFIFINIIGYKYFIIAYLPCFMVFNYWLYTVTYMQHHDEISKTGSIMYDDSTFTFLEGALQTIDRKYGDIIDKMHHNITNGHVGHHIYFTKISHYHLIEATNAVKNYLKAKNKYKFIPYITSPKTSLRVSVTNGYNWVNKSSQNLSPQLALTKISAVNSDSTVISPRKRKRKTNIAEITDFIVNSNEQSNVK
eukprot:324315_1